MCWGFSPGCAAVPHFAPVEALSAACYAIRTHFAAQNGHFTTQNRVVILSAAKNLRLLFGNLTSRQFPNSPPTRNIPQRTATRLNECIGLMATVEDYLAIM